MKVIIRKLSESENPKHPKNIETGAIYKGSFTAFPCLGERFCIGGISQEYNERGFSTSLVQEILSQDTFRTFNSIYHFTIINGEQSLKV